MSTTETPDYTRINQMFQCYSICTLVIYVKYTVCQFIGSNFENHPKEDAKSFPKGMQSVSEDKKRRERAFLNDLENIPFDLLIFWVAFLVQIFAFMTGSTSEETLALIILISIYTFLRVFYTFCYYFAWQPFRTIAFSLAKLTALGPACVIIASAFKTQAAFLLLKIYSTDA